MEYTKRINAFFNLIKGEGSFKLDKDDYQAAKDLFTTLGKIVKEKEVRKSIPFVASIFSGASKLSIILFVIGVLLLIATYFMELSLSGMDYMMIIVATIACAVMSIIFALLSFLLILLK